MIADSDVGGRAALLLGCGARWTGAGHYVMLSCWRRVTRGVSRCSAVARCGRSGPIAHLGAGGPACYFERLHMLSRLRVLPLVLLVAVLAPATRSQAADIRNDRSRIDSELVKQGIAAYNELEY